MNVRENEEESVELPESSCLQLRADVVIAEKSLNRTVIVVDPMVCEDDKQEKFDYAVDCPVCSLSMELYGRLQMTAVLR